MSSATTTANSKLPGVLRRGDKLLTRSLELNVTTHCNLKCYGCGRGSPAFAEESVSVSDLAADLSALAKVLHVREFRLAGGEPLQHPAIVEIADLVRRSGVADEITLITNGVLLHQAPVELWKQIDQMWVSVYPGVKRGLTRDEILSLGAAHNVKVRYKITDSFSRRMLNAENRDRELVRDIYADCYQRNGCHSIYQGRYFKCASGPLVPKWLGRVGAGAGDFSADGVSLRDNPALRRELENYLASEEPLTACRYCLGGSGKSFQHRQLNGDGVQAWLDEDHSNVRDLVDLERLNTARRGSNGIFSLWRRMRDSLVSTLTKDAGTGS